MHPEAHDGLARMLDAAGLDETFTGAVLDFGGRDINGSVRSLLSAADWLGVDKVPGPGVHLVLDLTTVGSMPVAFGHAIVCTEVFEHVREWPQVVRAAAQSLRADGPELFFVTCASTGRRPHGASGEMDPPPGEWYANVPPGELEAVLQRHFKDVHVEYRANPGDAYAWAQGVLR
ncbi:hypothetical protein [Streptomyces sp. NBC_01373]|uniref:hypothetical protein n=1 Tax=Streptomyces sp. NBC_01373 TaxID=2903843 RepID=UPI00225111D0|nr:hypothetical protein [Streptomyces sp. NBC_01373]MCX4704372.1 class I SAM-dependent methyltransferase [Streptomyces sp. NBC_01373]MCX4707112.1 class I SAM-dependent methyltransferase [Streptomyces sp. NBC_01373]